MSKVDEYLNEPSHKCSLCGTVYPFLLIKNEFTGHMYCSEQCKNTDDTISRCDSEDI